MAGQSVRPVWARAVWAEWMAASSWNRPVASVVVRNQHGLAGHRAAGGGAGFAGDDARVAGFETGLLVGEGHGEAGQG
jgi:hypothetical protein